MSTKRAAAVLAAASRGSGLLLVLAGLAINAQMLAQAPGGSQQPPSAPGVFSAEIDGIVHPVAAQFVQRTIERADREGATLVVFTLRTPGGSARSVLKSFMRMANCRLPKSSGRPPR